MSSNERISDDSFIDSANFSSVNYQKFLGCLLVSQIEAVEAITNLENKVKNYLFS